MLILGSRYRRGWRLLAAPMASLTQRKKRIGICQRLATQCSSRFHEQGVSLIEIMIVCVIVALAAAVAVPWYGDHVRRGRVSEGVELGSVARVKAAELVTIGQVTASGVPMEAAWAPPIMLDGQSAPLPEPTFEVISSNPSPYVAQVLRIQASYVVTYSPKLDPKTNAIYSIVYSARVNNGTVTWTCQVGDSARDNLVAASSYSRVDLGQPLPGNLAPKDCVA